MARISAVGLKNFKSIGATSQQVGLAPITLLFGANSAGKSTVLQAALLNKGCSTILGSNYS